MRACEGRRKCCGGKRIPPDERGSTAAAASGAGKRARLGDGLAAAAALGLLGSDTLKTHTQKRGGEEDACVSDLLFRFRGTVREGEGDRRRETSNSSCGDQHTTIAAHIR